MEGLLAILIVWVIFLSLVVDVTRMSKVAFVTQLNSKILCLKITPLLTYDVNGFKSRINKQ